MDLKKDRIIKACDKIILFLLYVIAFFLPISKAIIESASIAAIIFYLVKKILKWEDIPDTRLNIPLFSYLTICILSMFMSTNLEVSAKTLFLKTLQYFSFFFVVVETLNTERRIRTFLYILFLSATLLGIDGIYQNFTHKDFIRNRKIPDMPRIYATFPTPNDFGCYLSTLIPFIVAAFFIKFRLKLLKIFLAALFILIFICLMLTVSRGAWLAFVASALYMSFWIAPLRIFLLALGLVIMIALPFYPHLLKQRLGNFFIFLDHSGIDRKAIWEVGWRMFTSHPWLGVGLGAFMFNFMRFVKVNYPYTIPYAHNCYLQMASEIGIIGLLSFLSILILFFYHATRVLAKRQKTFDWYILLAALAGILGYSIQMGVETSFYSLDLGMLFWLILGLGAALLKKLESEPNKGIATA